MPKDVTDKFTTHLKNVLTRALCFAVEKNEKNVTPQHLLWAITTQKGCIAAEVLRKHEVKITAVRNLVGATSDEPTKSNSQDVTPLLSDNAKRMIEKAVYIAHIYKHRYVGTEHLLAGMLEIEDEGLSAFFHASKIQINTIKDQLNLVFKSTSRFPEMEDLLKNVPIPQKTEVVSGSAIPFFMEDEDEDEEDEEKTPALDFFATDLTDIEVADTIDPVIGREEEIQRVMEILCRRNKNNPILTGEPGVGKTAIVEGLARRIAFGDVPPILMNKRILALDMTSIIAGTLYRGEFESRLKQVVEETKANSDIILFIDELHAIMGAGSANGSMDAANILKPALARGDMRCIGATTPVEFKKFIEPDAALERRFQSVKINEPSLDATLEILKGLAPYYESYHNVTIKPEALDAAVQLSNRYISDRFLPDKAIDLIDEAGASVRISAITDGKEIIERRKLEAKLKRLKNQKKEAITEERFDDAMDFKKQESKTKQEIKTFGETKTSSSIGEVGVAEIASVISRSTGIPANELVSEEMIRLKNLSKTLKLKIIGQTHVTDAVAKAILRSKTGINHPDRPQASFMFVGPSGVGKTQLAKTLAKELFQDKDALIHLDMSEYGEGYTVSKLIGSPAGYIGYRDSAKLTDQVKQKPYAIVLFDEIEKAHRDVQALLLQILETGTISDATGKAISFKQAVIIMTSNVGIDKFRGESLGFSDNNSPETVRGSIEKDLEDQFRPELLNRIDNILLFHPLKRESLEEIAKSYLEEIAERVRQKGIDLEYTKNIPEFIADISFSEQTGARAIRRYMQDVVETALAQKLLTPKRGKCLQIKKQGEKILVTSTKPRE